MKDMTHAQSARPSWRNALYFFLALFLLSACDSLSSGTTGAGGSAGIAGASGAAGRSSAGSNGGHTGSTVTFPSTTQIVVRFPASSSGAGGAAGASGTTGGGTSGSGGAPTAQCIPSSPTGSPPSVAVCGDGFRTGDEACDDGNTLAGDGCSPTCQVTPQLVSPRIEALGEVTRLNAGSSDTIGEFGGDGFFSGGSDYAPGAVVSTDGVGNAAPPEVYGSGRWGDFTYTFAGLTPGAPYTVRLHFAEIWFDSVGSRIFNVAINDVLVLENFDIVGVAGGPNKAVVREFNPVANASGQVVVTFTGITDNAKVNALELIPPISRAESLKRAVVQLNAGGDAVGSFGADEGFVEGGTPWTYSENVVALGGVVNAGPHEIYGSERYGNMSYTLGGLTPAALYTVRLHFAENYYESAGSRAFDVLINDTSVLEWFDVYAVAGAHQAVVRDFSAIANDDGQVVVTFISHRDNAELNGLELLQNIEQSTPSLLGRSIGAGRHPLAAGCNVIGTAFSEQTSDASALYFSTFKSAGQPSSTALIAQTHVSTPDPGVAALPGDDFVVAWTDSDADELGISLRKVVGGVPQGETIIANDDAAFSQSESDIVFDGKELVVAWKDSHDPINGPDLHYRLFTTDLKPLSGDQILAATAAVEDNVVLAGRNGHWAAAWRAGSQGMETVEVQSGSSHWTVGPFAPGATDDRPDLIFLDDSHLAVAFTKGTDPDNTGEANVPRLHAAVLDPSAPGATESFALAPAQTPYLTQLSVGQSEPNLVLASDHLLVSWRSDAIPGDPHGSELWSRRVPFVVSGDTVTLDPSRLEVPLVQTDAQREGDQGSFRMVATTLWPTGGLASVWDDSSGSFGAVEGGTDVVLQSSPDAPELPFKPAFDMLWVTQTFSDLKVFGFSAAQAADPAGQLGPAAVTLTLPDIGPADGHPHRIATFGFAPNGDMWLGYADSDPVDDHHGQYVAKLSASKLLTSGAVTPDFAFPLAAPGVSTLGMSTILFDPAGNMWVSTIASTGNPAGLFFFPAASIASAGTPSPTVVIHQSGISHAWNDMIFDGSGNMWYTDALAGTVNQLSASQLLSSNSAIVPAIVLSIGKYTGLALDPNNNLWCSYAGYADLFAASDILSTGAPSGVRRVLKDATMGNDGLGRPGAIGTKLRFDKAGNFWAQTSLGPNGFTASDFAVSGSPSPRCTLRDNGLLTNAKQMYFNPASFR